MKETRARSLVGAGRLVSFFGNVFRIPSLLALGFFLAVALHGAQAHANVCIHLPANPSQATVQQALFSCGAGNTVEGTGGVTSVSSTIDIPCGVTLQGPTTSPATMVFTTDTQNMFLFQQTGTCISSADSGLSYLRIDGGLALQIDGNDHENIIFRHNDVTHITAFENAAQNAAINFGAGDSNTIRGVDIEYNTIGDASSCANIDTIDQGGCGIEIFAETTPVSHMVNLTIKHNIFNHLNEAIHFYGSIYVDGNAANTCDNCDIEFNLFEQIHRITIEFQAQTINHPLIISNNVFMDPLNGFYNTYAVSTPCCQYGSTFGSPTISPAYLFQNNIEYSNAGQFEWGLEFWGNGTQGTNNLIQGNLCTGFTPGHSANMSISYNTLQGPVMAGTSCSDYLVGGPGAYIAGPENNANQVQTIKGNVKGPRPASIVSVAPQLSPAAGKQKFPLTVTVTDPGYTAPTDPFPLGNTGIWYTTDGSNPIPGSGTARYLSSGDTFTLRSAATVKAVGMWGVPPLPASYPVSYGFVPSTTISASYEVATGSPPSPPPTPPKPPPPTPPTPPKPPPTPPPVRLTRVSVVSLSHTLVRDLATHMIAACTYSDGATFACNEPDRYGNFVSEWQSSTKAVSVNERGVAAGVSVGLSRISAKVSGMTTPRWDMAVTAPRLTHIYLATLANVRTITDGDSLQIEAYGVYDNNLRLPLPDAEGHKINLWNTTNHALARVSTRGRVTGTSPGVVTVVAHLGSLLATMRLYVVAKPAGRLSASLPGTPMVAKEPPAEPAANAEIAELTTPMSSVGKVPPVAIASSPASPSKPPVPLSPGAPLADSFDGPLWRLEAPAGGSASVSGSHLFVGVPGGGNHDALSGRNNAVRVMQPVGDYNFTVSIKIDTPLFATDADTSQGLMVVGNDHNYLTYALETNGVSIGLSLHTIINGVAAAVCKESDFAEYQNPIYLRVTRDGSKYVALFSSDGKAWTEACNFQFTKIPTAVGPFAANSNENPANAMPVVMSVDSFQTP